MQLKRPGSQPSTMSERGCRAHVAAGPIAIEMLAFRWNSDFFEKVLQTMQALSINVLIAP
jgi:hypothetical protein